MVCLAKTSARWCRWWCSMPSVACVVINNHATEVLLPSHLLPLPRPPSFPFPNIYFLLLSFLPSCLFVFLFYNLIFPWISFFIDIHLWTYLQDTYHPDLCVQCRMSSTSLTSPDEIKASAFHLPGYTLPLDFVPLSSGV